MARAWTIIFWLTCTPLASDGAELEAAVWLSLARERGIHDSLRYASLHGAALAAAATPANPESGAHLLPLWINRWAGFLALGVTRPVLEELDALPTPLSERFWAGGARFTDLRLAAEEIRLYTPDLRLEMVAALVLEDRAAEAGERLDTLAREIDRKREDFGADRLQRAHDESEASLRGLLELALVRFDQDPFPAFRDLVLGRPWRPSTARYPLGWRLGASLAARSSQASLERYLGREVEQANRRHLATAAKSWQTGAIPPALETFWRRDLAALRELAGTMSEAPGAGSPRLASPRHRVERAVLDTAYEGHCRSAREWGVASTGPSWPEDLSLLELAVAGGCHLAAVAYGPGGAEGETALWVLISHDGARSWSSRRLMGLFVSNRTDLCSSPSRPSFDGRYLEMDLVLREHDPEIRPAPQPGTSGFEAFHVRLDTAEPALDGDGDGWEDVLERHLGTDPAVADSDGDGEADGLDPFPLLTPAELGRETPASRALAAGLSQAGPGRHSRPLFPGQGRSSAAGTPAESRLAYVLESEGLPLASLAAPGVAVMALTTGEAPAGTATPSLSVKLFAINRAQDEALLVAGRASETRKLLLVLEDGAWRLRYPPPVDGVEVFTRGRPAEAAPQGSAPSLASSRAARR